MVTIEIKLSEMPKMNVTNNTIEITLMYGTIMFEPVVSLRDELEFSMKKFIFVFIFNF